MAENELEKKVDAGPPPVPNELKLQILRAYNDPSVDGAQNLINTYEKSIQPQSQYFGNTVQTVPPKYQPIDPGLIDINKPKSDFGEKAAKIGAGIALGATEVVNPYSIPHGLETLGRAGYKYVTSPKGLLDSLQEADKEAWFPRMTIREVAPAIRTAVRVPFSDKSISQVYEEEKKPFEQFFTDPYEQSAQGFTELAGAVKDLPKLVKAAPAVAKSLYQAGKSVIGSANNKLLKLAGIRAMQDPLAKSALTPEQLQETLRLQKQLIGALPEEMKMALYENTDTVKKLVNSPPEARSVFSTVEQMRKQIKDTRDLIGKSVNEFRTAITSNNPQRFDTTELLGRIKEFKKSKMMSSGMSPLDSVESGDARTLDIIEGLLTNAKSKGSEFDSRDASIAIDTIDNILVKAGYYDEKASAMTDFNRLLHGFRQSMDEEFASMYPAFKDVKTSYANFMNNYSQLGKKIEGLGAEGFVANLYGKNKTESRIIFDRLFDSGNEAIKSFEDASKNKNYLSDTNGAYNSVVKGLGNKVKDIKFRAGDEILQEIAEKSVANKLSELGDPQLDRARDLIKQYASEAVVEADKKAQAAGRHGSTILGGIVGYVAHMLGLDPVSSSAIASATKYGAQGSIESLVRAKQGSVNKIATGEAEKIYSVDALLQAVKKSKVSKETKKMFEGAKFFLDKFGEESAKTFLGKVRLTKEIVNDLDKIAPNIRLSGGAAQSLVKGVQDTKEGGRGLYNDILNFEGSKITPSPEFQKRQEGK